jgi:hypothetical protein
LGYKLGSCCGFIPIFCLQHVWGRKSKGFSHGSKKKPATEQLLQQFNFQMGSKIAREKACNVAKTF